MIVRRGAIYIAELKKTKGSVQHGLRPVLVIQNNTGNRYSPTVIVVPITSKVMKKTYQPTHVRLSIRELEKDSIAQCEQITTIDKGELKKYICEVKKKKLREIDRAIEISTGTRK